MEFSLEIWSRQFNLEIWSRKFNLEIWSRKFNLEIWSRKFNLEIWSRKFNLEIWSRKSFHGRSVHIMLSSSMLAVRVSSFRNFSTNVASYSWMVQHMNSFDMPAYISLQLNLTKSKFVHVV